MYDGIICERYERKYITFDQVKSLLSFQSEVFFLKKQTFMHWMGPNAKIDLLL